MLDKDNFGGVQREGGRGSIFNQAVFSINGGISDIGELNIGNKSTSVNQSLLQLIFLEVLLMRSIDRS